MPIAEREHRKWLNPDVSLTNNPYSTENIENRAKQMHSFTSVDSSEDRKPEEDPEEIEEKNSEKKKYFSSNRDITRYKRDYYLPDSLAVQDAPPGCSILDVSRHRYSATVNIFSLSLVFEWKTIFEREL